MLAMRRRMADRGAEAVQQFGEDMLPLVMLFAISVTGLMLTASYTWMKGYAYDFLAILHAVTVILTLLWLPFGKFFHIFQRPAQLGVSFYKDAGRRGEQAKCARCGNPFAPAMMVARPGRRGAAAGLQLRDERRGAGPLPAGLPQVPPGPVRPGPGGDVGGAARTGVER